MMHLDKLTTLFYDSALHKASLTGAFSRLRQSLRSDQLILRKLNSHNHAVAEAVLDAEDALDAEFYDASYLNRDPWAGYCSPNFLMRVEQENQFSTDRILSYREITRNGKRSTQDSTVLYVLGFMYADRAHYSITISRSSHRGRFTNKEVELMLAIFPHAIRAKKIHNNLQMYAAEASLLSEIFTSINKPLLVVDEQAVVRLINESAKNLIQQRNDIALVNGAIRTSSVETNAQFRKMIYQATGRNKDLRFPISLTEASKTENFLKIYVSPLRADFNADIPALAMVELSDNGTRKKISRKLLQDLYGLSPSEAKLAQGICDGLDTKSYCVKHQISRNTFKTQIRSCLSKTGTRNQADLIRVILNDIPI